MLTENSNLHDFIDHVTSNKGGGHWSMDFDYKFSTIELLKEQTQTLIDLTTDETQKERLKAKLRRYCEDTFFYQVLHTIFRGYFNLIKSGRINRPLSEFVRGQLASNTKNIPLFIEKFWSSLSREDMELYLEYTEKYNVWRFINRYGHILDLDFGRLDADEEGVDLFGTRHFHECIGEVSIISKLLRDVTLCKRTEVDTDLGKKHRYISYHRPTIVGRNYTVAQSFPIREQVIIKNVPNSESEAYGFGVNTGEIDVVKLVVPKGLYVYLNENLLRNRYVESGGVREKEEITLKVRDLQEGENELVFTRQALIEESGDLV